MNIPREVVTDEMALAFHAALTDSAIGQHEVDEIKTGLRAALAAQQEPHTVVPEQHQHQWDDAGERCVKCGDKDWMGGQCAVPDAAKPETQGERAELADRIGKLCERFSAGWHDGIEIDASDIADLSEAAALLSTAPTQAQQEPPTAVPDAAKPLRAQEIKLTDAQRKSLTVENEVHIPGVVMAHACQACGAPATRHLPEEATSFPGPYCDECGPGGKSAAKPETQGEREDVIKALYGCAGGAEDDGRSGLAELLRKAATLLSTAPTQAQPSKNGILPVAQVIEQLEGNQARIQWLFNPVPVGEELQWDHGITKAQP